MRKEIDGHYVAAQIRLLRQVRKGAILLVEGWTDAKVFDHFIDHKACEIEVGFGKRNVIDALDLLEDEGFSGIVGVVDADFDHLTGKTYSLENLCVTDVHDLDLVIFRSSAFNRYLMEHGDKEKIAKLFGGDVSKIRSSIVEACLPLGYCKLVSNKRGLNLRFTDIKHEDVVDEHALVMDQMAMINAVLARSAPGCTAATLNAFIESEKNSGHEHYQTVVGHDVAAVFGIALRQRLSDRRVVHTWASEIEAGLRLSFDWEALRGTKIYDFLRSWEVNNQPYRIFQI